MREKFLDYVTTRLLPPVVKRMKNVVMFSLVADMILFPTRFEFARKIVRRVMRVSLGVGVSAALVCDNSQRARRIKKLWKETEDGEQSTQRLKAVVQNTTSDDWKYALLCDEAIAALLFNTTVFGRREEIVLHERDKFMASRLFQGISAIQKREDNCDDEQKRRTAVVVVGAAHVHGLCDFFHDLLSGKESHEKVLSALLESDGFRQKHGDEHVNMLINTFDVSVWRPFYNLLRPRFNLEANETSV